MAAFVNFCFDQPDCVDFGVAAAAALIQIELTAEGGSGRAAFQPPVTANVR